VKRIPEVGDRDCYVLHRICAKPELDGVKDVTIYVDAETWLQVGSVLKDDKGLLIGSYYFRDIKLNPEFKKDQFTPAGLNP
jgi:outer membrane lipoprotein-sorting protein